MSLSAFFAYLLILLFATIIPGPSMLLALNHGVNHGFARTIYSGLGNLIGNLIMALLSILGLGAILLTSGVIFNIIKWCGIIYLLFIGLMLIFKSTKTENDTKAPIQLKSERSKMRLFIDGFIIALGNPKGILFFTALFPQFISEKNNSMNVFLIIFSTLGFVAFGCYMLYAVFGVRINKLFHKESFKKIYNRITGSLFIGIGVILAFSKK